MGALGGNAQGRSGAMMTDINVTPLVDVVLVLLVIMMMAATALASRTIPLELPRAQSGEANDSAPPLTVAVDEAGVLYIDQTRVDENALRARARERVSLPNASAVLAADGRARHETVVHVLELLRSERMARVAIVVRADGAP